jgi:hypothetical protein
MFLIQECLMIDASKTKWRRVMVRGLEASMSGPAQERHLFVHTRWPEQTLSIRDARKLHLIELEADHQLPPVELPDWDHTEKVEMADFVGVYELPIDSEATQDKTVYEKAAGEYWSGILDGARRNITFHDVEVGKFGGLGEIETQATD